VNGSFDTDRFGKISSSIYFNDGYASAPPGIYFDPDTSGFTVMSWLKYESILPWVRLIDFGNGQEANNIVVGQTPDNKIFTAVVGVSGGVGKSNLTLNSWLHISITSQIRINEKNMDSKIYINGLLDQNFTRKSLNQNTLLEKRFINIK